MRAATVLFCLCAATPAFAQEASEAVKEESRQHFRAGSAALDRNDFETAYREFRAVLELYPSRSASANAGIAAVATGRYVEGVRYLHAYVTTVEDPPEHVLVWYRQALDRVGRVRFEVKDPDVRVSLDGTLIHSTPPLAFDWFELPGEHTLRAEKTGAPPVEKRITFARGELRTERITFDAKPAEAPQVVPAAQQPQRAEQHRTMPTTGERSVSAKWITVAGLGLGTLVSGTATLVFALNGSAASSRIDDQERELRAQNNPLACYPSCSLDQSYEDRRDAYRAANIALVTTAGLGIATGLVYFLWEEPERRNARITPWTDGKVFGATLGMSLQ